ncbi:unnamed protein product [Brucella canis str. Oliveri]|nr:unnamed protein product [Brucella canis str. Oliveri]
MKIEYLFGRK